MWINYKERLGAFFVEAQKNTEVSGEILVWSNKELSGMVFPAVLCSNCLLDKKLGPFRKVALCQKPIK